MRAIASCMLVGGMAWVGFGCAPAGSVGIGTYGEDIRTLFCIQETEQGELYRYLILCHMPELPTDSGGVWAAGRYTALEHNYRRSDYAFHVARYSYATRRLNICGQSFDPNKGGVFLTVCWTNGYGLTSQLDIPIEELKRERSPSSRDVIERLAAEHSEVRDFLADAQAHKFPLEPPGEPWRPPNPFEVIGVLIRLGIRFYLLPAFIRGQL